VHACGFAGIDLMGTGPASTFSSPPHRTKKHNTPLFSLYYFKTLPF